MELRTLGDPILRTKALPVEVFDEQLRSEIIQIGAIMEENNGIGLAATQVGTLRQIFVWKLKGDPEGRTIALINPEIVWKSEEEETGEEECLSLPGVCVDVTRSVSIQVKAQNKFGASVDMKASGLEARIIQHEVDHLNGILILDYAE